MLVVIPCRLQNRTANIAKYKQVFIFSYYFISIGFSEIRLLVFDYQLGGYFVIDFDE